MININELRIGNWIKCTFMDVSYKHQVKAITRDEYIDVSDKESFNINCVHGIKITHEWLTAFGFTKLENDEWQFIIKISALSLACRCNSDIWYWQFSEIYLGDRIMYVHQLQNFCNVFGKELTI